MTRFAVQYSVSVGSLDPGVHKVCLSPTRVSGTGEPGSIPGLRRSPEEGNGNPLQYSCLENTMDRGAWQATVHRVTKS